MEQNLSDCERKRRLAIGVVFELVAVLVYLRQGVSALFYIFAFGGLGFVANYVTCFCGAKRVLDRFRDRLGGS